MTSGLRMVVSKPINVLLKKNIELLMNQEIYRERIANLSFAMAELMMERRDDMLTAGVI